MIKYLFLFLLLFGCTNGKKINSPSTPERITLHFLPVRISYTGIKLEDSLKNFIAQCFAAKKIEVIDQETSHLLITNEIRRAAGYNKPTDPSEFQKQINRNEQYVYNLVMLNFEFDSTGTQIVMGWKVDPEPVNFSRLVSGKWKYLTNHKISDSPPQEELKTLCDSIMYSKSLF